MRDRLQAAWEALYPYVFALLAGAGIRAMPIVTPVWLSDKGFSLPSFFGVLAGFNTFGAGVMITVFVFTMAPAAGFISKLEKLRLYKTFRRYTQEAIASGIIAGMLCMPLCAATPQALTKTYMAAISVTTLTITILFIFSFFRVARIFIFWSSQR